MRRQIIWRLRKRETENIVADIIGMMRDKVDMNCEFRISQKILPEKISEGKRNKEFLDNFFRTVVLRQQGKEMGKAICKEERGSDDSWLVQQSKCCGDLRSLRNFQ